MPTTTQDKIKANLTELMEKSLAEGQIGSSLKDIERQATKLDIQVTRQTLSNWSTGKNLPDIKQLQQSIKILELSKEAMDQRAQDFFQSSGGVPGDLGQRIESATQFLEFFRAVRFVVYGR